MGRVPLIILPILLLAGSCTHMPVTSMIKLARVDLTNTDPGELKAAVKLPRMVKPLAMALRIGVRIADGSEETQDFRLREIADADATLRQEAGGDTHVFVYRLDPAEVTRLTEFRDSLKQKQRERGGRGGSVTIVIEPRACRTGELPKGPVSFTSFLRTAETKTYVPLARDVDLRVVSAGRDLAAEIPPCG